MFGRTIAERVLGHARGGVEGIYDHYDFGPEKADALKRLAGLIDKIVNASADNVVLMSSNARAL